MNFDWLPGGTLVEGIVFGLCAGRVPFLIEPIEVRIVIRNPLLDRLPRRFDGLRSVRVPSAGLSRLFLRIQAE